MFKAQMTSRRLFIGLMPDTDVRAAIDDHRQRWNWPRSCRPTPTERLHLTLCFLGEVETGHEQILKDSLREVPVEPMVLVLRHPRVWNGGLAVLLPEPHAGLLVLQGRTEKAARRAGLRSAPGFTPHVTLARQATQALPPEACPPIRWTVSDVVLVWSRLPPKPGYEILARYDLARVDLGAPQG